jgi:hypothetical protein
MNTEQNTPTAPTQNSAGWVPVLVQAGLRRCSEQRVLVSSMPVKSAGEWAARLERLAAVAGREARWWSVLATWTYRNSRRPGGVPLVFGRALFIAIEDREQRARLLGQMATDWRRREAGELVCAVIGCGCGGADECEVTA